MHKALPILLLGALLLAGCAGSAATDSSATGIRPSTVPGGTLTVVTTSAPAQPPGGAGSASPASATPSAQPSASPSSSSSAPQRMTIHGVVTDLAIHPIAGANVTLTGSGLAATTVRTGPGGAFAFPAVAANFYTVLASAKGYRNQTLVARPGAEELDFTLDVDVATLTPYNQTFLFKGHLDCGFEVLIIPGPCDLFLKGAHDPHLFSNQTTFFFATDVAWRSIVLDFAFTPPTVPTFAGYHFTLRAPSDPNQLDSYQQFGQFQGTKSFTTLLAPGETYPGNTDGPLPGNVTRFKLDVYPMGYGWHALCPTACLTGVGAGVQMDFTIVATVFYVTPAPDGFTTLHS